MKYNNWVYKKECIGVYGLRCVASVYAKLRTMDKCGFTICKIKWVANVKGFTVLCIHYIIWDFAIGMHF